MSCADVWILSDRFELLCLIYHSDVKASGSLGGLSDASLSKAIGAKLLSQYQGSADGVLSINQLGSALEVLSERNMNAYG